MKKRFFAPLVLLAAYAVSGCVPAESGNMLGRFTSVSVVDSSERIKLDTKISMSDIVVFTENMTNKMLQSPVFAKAKRPPRVIVTAIRNNTHDENLRVSDIHDCIMETMLNSGKVRLLDESALNFNYVMRTELSDIITRSPDGQKLVDYLLQIKLFDLDGELKGHWSDKLSLFKNR